MEISSLASQALAVKENMTQAQLGVAAMKQAAQTQQQMAEMLAKNTRTVTPVEDSHPGTFSTYA